MERSQVRWGTTLLGYEIRRSARRGTVAIAVEPSGAIVVTAPPGASTARLDRVVLDKARWITERLRRRESVPPPRGREFVSGESCRYLGRQYRLRVEVGAPVGPMRLHGAWLHLAMPAHLPEIHRARYARAALTDWYLGRAHERLPEWTRAWAAKSGRTMSGVLVARQDKRWGSCSRGVLRLNWRIVQAPRALVDYVIAHEVTHLGHDKHDAAFWRALGELMPDYEARRERLRLLGPELVW